MVSNVNGVIYPWTLTCKQSDCIWCEKGLLRQHGALAVKSSDFAHAHYAFSMQNSWLPACCLFCSCSYQNDANSLEKCHVMKMHYIYHVLWTGSWLTIALLLLSSPCGNLCRATSSVLFIPPMEASSHNYWYLQLAWPCAYRVFKCVHKQKTKKIL